MLIVFAAWATWLGGRTGAPRTWGLFASLAVLGGAVATILAAVHAFAEHAVPMWTIARGVAFGSASAVALATLHHAYRRQPWSLFEPGEDER